ncbi:MAG TPA: glycosyl hydrolase family 18 protein, partial [Blastocatellia bacterium]
MTVRVCFSRTLVVLVYVLSLGSGLLPVAIEKPSLANTLNEPGGTVRQSGKGSAGAARGRSRAGASQFENHHLLIGYWQNFANEAAHLTLGQVSGEYDVINVAFGTPAPGTTSRVTFAPDPEVESLYQFRTDVASLHRAGKKVVLSIGGAESPVVLNNARDVNSFVSSVASIVTAFRFDGIDIDFEEASLQLNPGDSDFKHPTTPSIVNL